MAPFNIKIAVFEPNFRYVLNERLKSVSDVSEEESQGSVGVVERLNLSAQEERALLNYNDASIRVVSRPSQWF